MAYSQNIVRGAELISLEPVEIRSPLEQSWLCLLLLATLCAFLSFLVTIQVGLRFSTHVDSSHIRAVLIPEAEPVVDSELGRYRFFLSQVVQRVRGGSFYEGRDLSDLIVRVSAEERIDPLLVAAIVKAESTFSPTATSHRGARGLMQIRASTAQYIAEKLDLPWRGERALHDPEHNLRLGISYLKYLSKKFDGNIERILAAYNWGPGNVLKLKGKKKGMPSETVKYVTGVLESRQKWKAELTQQLAQLADLGADRAA